MESYNKKTLNILICIILLFNISGCQRVGSANVVNSLSGGYIPRLTNMGILYDNFKDGETNKVEIKMFNGLTYIGERPLDYDVYIGEIYNENEELLYSGGFSDWKFHGSGSLSSQGSIYYDGEFKDGLPNGEGYLYLDKNHIYKGNFANGYAQGKGELELANGNTYKGFWIDGNFMAGETSVRLEEFKNPIKYLFKGYEFMCSTNIVIPEKYSYDDITDIYIRYSGNLDYYNCYISDSNEFNESDYIISIENSLDKELFKYLSLLNHTYLYKDWDDWTYSQLVFDKIAHIYIDIYERYYNSYEHKEEMKSTYVGDLISGIEDIGCNTFRIKKRDVDNLIKFLFNKTLTENEIMEIDDSISEIYQEGDYYYFYTDYRFGINSWVHIKEIEETGVNKWKVLMVEEDHGLEFGYYDLDHTIINLSKDKGQFIIDGIKPMEIKDIFDMKEVININIFNFEEWHDIVNTLSNFPIWLVNYHGNENILIYYYKNIRFEIKTIDLTYYDSWDNAKITINEYEKIYLLKAYNLDNELLYENTFKDFRFFDLNNNGSKEIVGFAIENNIDTSNELSSYKIIDKNDFIILEISEASVSEINLNRLLTEPIDDIPQNNLFIDIIPSFYDINFTSYTFLYGGKAESYIEHLLNYNLIDEEYNLNYATHYYDNYSWTGYDEGIDEYSGDEELIEYFSSKSNEIYNFDERYFMNNIFHDDLSGRFIRSDNFVVEDKYKMPYTKNYIENIKKDIDNLYLELNKNYKYKYDPELLVTNIEEFLESLFTIFLGNLEQPMVLDANILKYRFKWIEEIRNVLNETIYKYDKLNLQRKVNIPINIDRGDVLLYDENITLLEDVQGYMKDVDNIKLFYQDGFIDIGKDLLQKYFQGDDKLNIFIDQENNDYTIMFKNSSEQEILLPENIKIGLKTVVDNPNIYFNKNNIVDNIGGNYDEDGQLISFQIKTTGQYNIEKANDKPVFKDLEDEDEDVKLAAHDLAEKDILLGDDLNTFNPDAPLTRYEFTKAIVKILYELDRDYKTSFKDISDDDYYYSYIASSEKNNIVAGYPDNTFKGERFIAREEMLTICSKALKEGRGYLYPDDPSGYINFKDKRRISEYAMEYIALAIIQGLLDGDKYDKLEPQGSITRGEAAVILHKLNQDLNS